MTQRIFWIDILRAIGIFLVVIVHTGRLDGESWLLDYIRAFFMPLFFFISGLLVKEDVYKKSFKTFIQQLSQRLVIPYLFFSIMSYLAWLLLFQFFKDQPFDTTHNLIGIFYGATGDGRLSHNIALWFFTALFSVQIYFYVLFRLRCKLRLFSAVLLFASILGYLCTTVYTVRLPWNLGVSLTALVFYGVGYLLSRQLRSGSPWFLNPYVAIASLIVYILAVNDNSRVEFYVGDYGSYMSFYAAAFAGIFLFAYLAKVLSSIRGIAQLLSIIGKHTLVIFSTHLLVIPLITGFLVYAVGISRSSLAKGSDVALLYSTIAIGVTFGLSIVCNRYCPIVLGRLPKSLVLRRQVSQD